MEQLNSVGIDIGTSTTQLVLSRLVLENRGNAFSVPRIVIAAREVLYRSPIHFTPLLSDTEIDAQGVRDIAAEEYRRAGVSREEVDTGAVIITGETARKDNARQVLESLSGFAGEFVVATAGPDLESILAARGAGIDQISREEGRAILHMDIGGGTSNLALYDRGELTSTGCLDVGGRLVRLDREGRVSYLAPKVRAWLAESGGSLTVGQKPGPGELDRLTDALAQALEEAAGLRPPSRLLELFTTHHTASLTRPPEAVSFSGGVADCIWQPPEDPMAYGDIGVLLGRRIAASPLFRGLGMVRGRETIRATVVGAGTHTTQLSGSTIFWRGVEFPIQNLPVLRLSQEEEQAGPEELARAIARKVAWFADHQGMAQVLLSLRGQRSPSFQRVGQVAQAVSRGLEGLKAAGYFPAVAVEQDMAKTLGQALALREAGPVLCLDGVAGESGDYVDVGAPVAGGAVVPVVVKTLVFQ